MSHSHTLAHFLLDGLSASLEEGNETPHVFLRNLLFRLHFFPSVIAKFLRTLYQIYHCFLAMLHLHVYYRLITDHGRC